MSRDKWKTGKVFDPLYSSSLSQQRKRGAKDGEKNEVEAFSPCALKYDQTYFFLH